MTQRQARDMPRKSSSDVPRQGRHHSLRSYTAKPGSRDSLTSSLAVKDEPGPALLFEALVLLGSGRGARIARAAGTARRAGIGDSAGIAGRTRAARVGRGARVARITRIGRGTRITRCRDGGCFTLPESMFATGENACPAEYEAGDRQGPNGRAGKQPTVLLTHAGPLLGCFRLI